ncbi:MAG: DAK2 domain-containing protein, partial [Anaerolineaceae bacterium]
FLGCGRAVNGAEHLTKEDVETMLVAGLAQVQKRGKAQVGDKTMVDALAPAVSEYQSAIEAGLGMSQALRKAAEGAQAGAEATKDMVARVGRAKYVGERSLGCQDAGATTMALLFTAWEGAL